MQIGVKIEVEPVHNAEMRKIRPLNLLSILLNLGGEPIKQIIDSAIKTAAADPKAPPVNKLRRGNEIREKKLRSKTCSLVSMFVMNG